MIKITQQARDIAADTMASTNNWSEHLRNGQRDYAPIVIAVQRALDAPRVPMTDDEILQRARHGLAFIMTPGSFSHGEVMRGSYDGGASVRAVIAALRDLDKPVGPHPDVIVCREFMAAKATDEAAARIRAGESDDSDHMHALLAAYRANPVRLA